MSNPHLVFAKRFVVEAHQVNREKHLTIPSLMKSLQSCSFQHSRQLKTSVWDMEDEHLSWVLLRKQLRIITPLSLDASYRVVTYPSGFEKFFAFRDFLVFDGADQLVAAASSTWTMIDTVSRKLQRIPEKIINIGVPMDVKFLTRPDKSMFAEFQAEKVDVRKIRPYDLDWNNHTSNLVLVRYAMEVLKDLGLEDHQVRQLNIHFKNEILLGDLADIYLGQSQDEGSRYEIEIKRTEQTVAIAKVMTHS